MIDGGGSETPEDGRTVEGGGPARAPLRRCIVTRNPSPKGGLIRFVVDPSGTVVPDLTERLPGRGLWVSARGDVLSKAVAKNAFARAARQSVTVPADLVGTVEALLARHCADLLGMARSAGALTFGAARVSEWLTRNTAGVVLQATDGSEGTRERVRILIGDVPLVVALRTAELAQVVGRERAVHVAVARGRLADRIVAEGRRLEGFRQGPHCGSGA
ncbi:MAG: RNA-binding protein [Acetobacterales bacterium]